MRFLFRVHRPKWQPLLLTGNKGEQHILGLKLVWTELLGVAAQDYLEAHRLSTLTQNGRNGRGHEQVHPLSHCLTITSVSHSPYPVLDYNGRAGFIISDSALMGSLDYGLSNQPLGPELWLCNCM